MRLSRREWRRSGKFNLQIKRKPPPPKKRLICFSAHTDTIYFFTTVRRERERENRATHRWMTAWLALLLGKTKTQTHVGTDGKSVGTVKCVTTVWRQL